ncbi:MAG: sulfate transporter CysZ [Methylobacter sp.]|uniref:sulfate transporter CysZ n=1 Tax=Methylobacter sp. TaxID=2051955 RepID=UPI0025910581|nr:sulfate transporter CysZ [Methylobacter sp.]MCL7420659.1 sulfate transporter CysZ [Methylobacter sp.]
MQLSKKGNNPVLAVGYFFRGLRLLTDPQLRAFLIIPVLINLVLYSVVLALGYFYVSDLIDQFIPDWLQWLNWILWPLFFISFFIAGFFSFTVLANLIAAPFYGKLAAKTLSIITGEGGAGEEQPLTKVMVAELKRIGYLVVRALPLLLLFIIPGINVIAPFLWALFGAWGMALEYMAYPLENEGMLFTEQKQLAKSIRLGALGFGGITMAGLTLPLLNIVVAPAAVIGATIYLHEVKQD